VRSRRSSVSDGWVVGKRSAFGSPPSPQLSPSRDRANVVRLMLRSPTTEYPLCLLDTLAVSEMVKRPEGAFRHYLEWAHDGEPPFVPCFTVYTLIELRRKPALFNAFIEHFRPFPCVLLKGYMDFLTEEVSSYPDPSGIDPCAIVFTPPPFGSEGNLLANLPQLLRLPELVKQEKDWNEAGPEIVEGMVSLVPNYPPDGTTYTTAEVSSFIEIASLTQLALHGHADFAQSVLDHRGEPLDMDAFPSLKAMTNAVFYKFYADLNRNSSNSDAFDVLISAALPYVEAIITESHLAEALRKTMRRDDFLGELQVFTLRDFRAGRPVTARPNVSATPG
jgi:hypothetical protein